MDRRYFLRAGVGAAGGLAIALQTSPWAFAHRGGETPHHATDGVFNAYLEINDVGVFITCPQSEMGQGVHDGLSKILADELGADCAGASADSPRHGR
jgi:isoquinoline 1-oxidoreductase beta subunit